MIKIIAAMSLDRAIGYYPNPNKVGQLPWTNEQAKGDLAMFKDLTQKHVVVMGRKTFESMNGQPLPGRYNIIVSRKNQPKETPNTVRWVKSLRDAIGYAGLIYPEKDIYLIGGNGIFSDGMPLAEEIILTIVPIKAYEQFEPDRLVYFPSIRGHFERTKASQHPFNAELRIIRYGRPDSSRGVGKKGSMDAKENKRK